MTDWGQERDREQRESGGRETEEGQERDQRKAGQSRRDTQYRRQTGGVQEDRHKRLEIQERERDRRMLEVRLGLEVEQDPGLSI